MNERMLVRLALVIPWLPGCNLELVGAPTGGVSVIREPGCPAAALVVMSDFIASQVAISALDGETLSASFVSTASAPASGLAFALSGDISLPSTRPPSERVVIVDRYGTNVLTWLDPETAKVLAQLSVGTGFESNPQDYLELDERRALVSRWDENPAPGREPFDRGGDLLVIDTLEPDVENAIALPRPDEFPPHPGALVRVGEMAVVTLERFARDFKSAGHAMLVGVDPASESVAWSFVVDGVKNCGGLTLSPSAQKAALACTGFIDADGRAQNLDESALVVFDVTSDPPSELRRFSARELADEPLQNEVEFFSEAGVLVKTQTEFGGSGRGNRLLTVDLGSGQAETLAEAGGAGRGIVFGGLLCTPGCGNVCLLADADRRVLRRWAIDAEGLEPLRDTHVEDRVGLPPRGLGSY